MTETSFRKYTSLPVLLNILNTKIITLSDPKKWEDRNDSYFIEVYKRLNKYKTVLVSCFSEAEETYHHWKIYAGNASGICIEFDKDKLVKKMANPNVIMKNVEYPTIRNLSSTEKILPEQIPFYKRYPFKDEMEFRVIYFSKFDEKETFDIEIDYDCIKKIIISPWLDKSLAKNTVKIIKSFDLREDTLVYQSELLENEKWLAIAKAFETPKNIS